jgi:hypothetical protein
MSAKKSNAPVEMAGEAESQHRTVDCLSNLADEQQRVVSPAFDASPGPASHDAGPDHAQVSGMLE